MLAIPKRLLSQSVTVRLPVAGGYGGECADPVYIEHVRFEAAAATSQTAYQLQAPIRGTLFIDAVNSSPAMELPAGTMVLLDGETAECTVRECQTLLDGRGRVHHWEATLA